MYLIALSASAGTAHYEIAEKQRSRKAGYRDDAESVPCAVHEIVDVIVVIYVIAHRRALHKLCGKHIAVGEREFGVCFGVCRRVGRREKRFFPRSQGENEVRIPCRLYECVAVGCRLCGGFQRVVGFVFQLFAVKIILCLRIFKISAGYGVGEACTEGYDTAERGDEQNHCYDLERKNAGQNTH